MPGNPGVAVDGAGPSRLDAAVIAEQIRLLLQKRADLPVNLINAGIVSAALWRLYPSWLEVTWLSLFSIVILARSLIRRRYRIAAPGVEKARYWGRIFTGNAFATAFMWGLTGSVILVTSNGVYHVFIVFVLGGMLTGSIVSNAAYKPAMFAMILPAILPVIVVLVSRPSLMQIEMGVMLAMFAIVLILAGRNINRSIVENFRLRIAQDFLSVKLRASEAAMAEAQALAHVGSWEHDFETDSDVWSAEALRIFQADPATPRPGFKTILARVHPDDLAMVEKDYANVTATGIDHRIVMDDGAIRFVHDIVRTSYDAHGRPLRVHGIVQDITERRSSEDKLQFANVLLTAEKEASPDGILVVDAKRTILSFNRRFAEIWKIPLADLAARNDGKVLAQVTSSVKDSQKFQERIEYLYAHPGEDSHEEYETTGGRFIDRYTVTLATPGGVYLGRVWFFRDITDRKSAEEKLQFANLLLTTEMEASPDGILVVDPNRKITSFNQRFADIWKIPPASLAAGNDDTVLEQSMSQVKDPQKVTALIQQLYANRSRTAHDELELTDGRFIERHSVTLNTAAGEHLGRVWFFRDVTRGKQEAAHALRMARFDGLTGLANRSVFVEALERAVAAAKRG